MKQIYPCGSLKPFIRTMILVMLLSSFQFAAEAQNCPSASTVILASNPNTYYPGLSSTVSAGSKNITLGAAGSGSTAISPGDLLLIIQMQGAQINATNDSTYGNGVKGGAVSGYLNNSKLLAGNMEYVVAQNSVSLAGGTLKLNAGTKNSYSNADYGTDGQYRYQVIRVALYYNLTLSASIIAPDWNGTIGGVLVMTVTNKLNFNGQILSAAGAGFRGGAARQLKGGTGGSNKDFVNLSTYNFHGSKGEGIAGTPRYVNNGGVLLDNGAAAEGYPNGSYGMGAPGNAGGGGTDGKPTSNDQNSGGGGGANGGSGGKGGNSWSSNLATGGEQGSAFAQVSSGRLIMGGGGGAGTTNDGTGVSTLGFSTSGAAGGGIVLLTVNTVSGSGTIDVSGETGNLTVLNDGSGGGGAGGSVMIFSGSSLSTVTVKANGGSGGTNTGTGSPHGPGGGGGGGVVYSNKTLNAATTIAGGTAGLTAGSSNYSAVAGQAGILVQNIQSANVPNLALSCTVLPVDFVSVTATASNRKTTVNWDVANENGVQAYEVQQSTDGKNFSTVTTVAYKASGLSFNSYSVELGNTGNQTVYYRIYEIAWNGSTDYSKIVMVKATQEQVASMSVSPNPATGSNTTVVIKNGNLSSGSLVLRLVGMQGNIVWQKEYSPVSGCNTIQLNNLAMVPNGVYL
ncbi:MAG: hypothetical protein JST39_07440, partial [Bacteroidetes bacterium]|nr:hypothetical protein [Bacteroidota bacterium]